MKSTELKIKLEKALEKVEKTKKTIERHQKQAEKKLAVVKAGGWDENDKYCRANTPEHHDAYWAICDYQGKLADIKGAEKKLAEAEKIANNWADKLAKQIETELKIATEIPEAFKEARAELVEEWVAGDIRARDVMKEKRRELSYEEFRKIYTYTAEQDLNHTDEEFRKIEEREADIWLLNLYNRVKEITGEVTDCKYLSWGGKCLDGYVIGKNGKALVETIGAGGYNIQRFHLRVLVKEYK